MHFYPLRCTQNTSIYFSYPLAACLTSSSFIFPSNLCQYFLSIFFQWTIISFNIKSVIASTSMHANEPNSSQPNSNETHAHESSSPHSKLRCLIIFIICFVIWIIFGVGLAIIFCPHAPKFKIKSASVSSFCISNNRMNALWNIIHFVSKTLI